MRNGPMNERNGPMNERNGPMSERNGPMSEKAHKVHVTLIGLTHRKGSYT